MLGYYSIIEFVAETETSLFELTKDEVIKMAKSNASIKYILDNLKVEARINADKYDYEYFLSSNNDPGNYLNFII